MRRSYLERLIPHIGRTFNELTILSILDKLNSSGRIMCRCLCSCGRIVELGMARVMSGHNKSCGMCGYTNRMSSATLTRDITGMRSGKLVAVRITDDRDPWGQRIWECKCDCGNTVFHPCGLIVKQMVKSCNECGYSKQRTSETHLKYKTKDEKYLADCFYRMRDRCYNPHSECFHWYGERGIYICSEWIKDPMSFVKWALENGYKPGLTIERVDVNGPYAPWNCRWATKLEQAWNKTNTRWITLLDEHNNPVKKSLAEWCHILNCRYAYRHLSGLNECDAINELTIIQNWGSVADYEEYLKNECDENGEPLSTEVLFQGTIFDEKGPYGDIDWDALYPQSEHHNYKCGNDALEELSRQKKLAETSNICDKESDFHNGKSEKSVSHAA